MASKAQLETQLRNKFLDLVTKAIEDALNTEVLPVSASELAVPCTDTENNDKWVLIKISVPRGTRDGQGGYEPYDGYSVAEDYAFDCEEKARKQAEAERKKQAKIAKDEAKRAEKKALAEANKNLKELRKIKLNEGD